MEMVGTSEAFQQMSAADIAGLALNAERARIG